MQNVQYAKWKTYCLQTVIWFEIQKVFSYLYFHGIGFDPILLVSFSLKNLQFQVLLI